jgi:hypothetical protein
MPNSQDIDTLLLNSIESLMRDEAIRKTDTEKATLCEEYATLNVIQPTFGMVDEPCLG